MALPHPPAVLRYVRMKPDSFVSFVLDQLRSVPDLLCRRMFSGHGLYSSRTFFGIISHGRFYLKTDDRSRPRYIDCGMTPFTPRPQQVLKSYYEVPVDVLENHERLTEWAGDAIRCQPAAKQKKKSASKRRSTRRK